MSALANNSLTLGSSVTLSQNLVIKSNTDGTFTIERESGADLITIDAAGKVNLVGNVVPAFSAYQSSVQSMPNNTFTKVQLQSEEYDTNSNFDSTTNYRFTATIAGIYQINGAINYAGGVQSNALYIYKNGVRHKSGQQWGTSQSFGNNVSVLVQLAVNDYVELFAYQAVGTAINVSVGLDYTYFQGCLVRSA